MDGCLSLFVKKKKEKKKIIQDGKCAQLKSSNFHFPAFLAALQGCGIKAMKQKAFMGRRKKSALMRYRQLAWPALSSNHPAPHFPVLLDLTWSWDPRNYLGWRSTLEDRSRDWGEGKRKRCLDLRWHCGAVIPALFTHISFFQSLLLSVPVTTSQMHFLTNTHIFPHLGNSKIETVSNINS